MNEAENDLKYDSNTSNIPLPPGVDAHWLAREGIHILLNNGGVNHAQKLFQKYKKGSVVLSAAASLIDFIAAAMSFEDEKMEIAQQSLKNTIKVCDIDSCFEGLLNKRPSQMWSTAERIERMIIWADCELFLAFLMFLKQNVVDFLKAGFHMRRAWKMYEKCCVELYGCDMNTKSSKKNASSSTPCSVLSIEEAKLLTASFSFGYGLVQIALSVVPATFLKFCEIIGFHVNKEVGLSSLMISSNSNDMKSPIARLTLLWYHTVVCPFCNVEGESLEKGLHEAAEVLKGSEEEFPNSTVFIYFRALLCRLRGNLEESLNLLTRTVSTNTDQKEIALLCYYDKGWCHLLKMEWKESIICFSKLQSESKWSEAYYTYLLAVTSGALHQLDEAYILLKSVPKKIVRKTQLEIYLTRKCQLYKKTPPAQMEYVILILELLYLWNSFPQCTEHGLRAILTELRKYELGHMSPIKTLMMGAIHSKLCENESALTLLEQASIQTKTKPIDAHVIPYAMYEMAMIYAKDERTWQLSKDMLCKVKDTFKNYDFENRLLFRIHAALNSLEDKEMLRLAKLKLTPPKIDGL